METESRDCMRKTRGENRKIKKHELNYYFIIINSSVNKDEYLYDIKKSIDNNLSDKIKINVINENKLDVINICKNIVSLEPQYCISWIIYDNELKKDFYQLIQIADRLT